MNISVETQHLKLRDHWRDLLEERMSRVSDPSNPIVSVRATLAFHESEQPPGECRLVIGVSGKSIVVARKAETVDIALKNALDTAKREVRQYYDMRSSKKRSRTTQMPGLKPITPEEAEG